MYVNSIIGLLDANIRWLTLYRVAIKELEHLLLISDIAETRTVVHWISSEGE